MLTPDKWTITREVPKGRQRQKQSDTKQATYSVTLSGFSGDKNPVPGVTPPSVVSRTFGANFPDIHSDRLPPYRPFHLHSAFRLVAENGAEMPKPSRGRKYRILARFC